MLYYGIEIQLETILNIQFSDNKVDNLIISLSYMSQVLNMNMFPKIFPNKVLDEIKLEYINNIKIRSTLHCTSL